MPPKPDSLDTYIDAAAQMLALPVAPEWKPAVRAHLEAALQLAEIVEQLQLPDEAEPAPVFGA
jgi:hypothetical protein